MATCADLADAVATAINDADLEPSLTAERAWRPRFDLEEMAELKVSVVPRGAEQAIQSRSRTRTDYRVEVAVQKRPDDLTSETLDPLVGLVEAVADLFRFRRLALPGGAEAVWVRTEHEPLVATDHLDELRQLTSVLVLTFRVTR